MLKPKNLTLYKVATNPEAEELFKLTSRNVVSRNQHQIVPEVFKHYIEDHENNKIRREERFQKFKKDNSKDACRSLEANKEQFPVHLDLYHKNLADKVKVPEFELGKSKKVRYRSSKKRKNGTR